MNETTEQPEVETGSRYIEFTHGKLGLVKKVKWDGAIGDPVHSQRFIFTDEFGEDWGCVLREIPEPDFPPEDESGDEEEGEDGYEDPMTAGLSFVKGIASRYFTPGDEETLNEVLKDEVEYLATCRERVEHHGLKMKMLASDIRFDRKKITFHFAAEGRIDFRMLVRDLASIFRCRIELHQIGARDEAKLHIGCGPCGRNLCCRTWLNEFQPIGIKMARAQNLPLNPGKISGNCGRLLCCLSYEYDIYLDLAKKLPKAGDRTEIDGLPYEVTYISPLAQTVSLVCLNTDERHKRLKATRDEYYAGSVKRKK